MSSLSKICKPVMEQIKDLQNDGVQISIDGKAYTVYFVLFNFSGDNLELHNVLGFHESFNSNYPCRLCYMDKKQCYTSIKEDVK